MGDKIIDVFIINYNGKNTILKTIESLYQSENVNISISIIDDCSTDNSLELIRQSYPNIPINVMPFNTRRPNKLRNMACEKAKSEFVFITDNDLMFEKNCLYELIKEIKSDEKIATCSPRLMYWDKPNKVYFAGTKVHYIGAAITGYRDQEMNDFDDKPSLNSGGGIALLRKSAVINIEGFDEDYMWGWGEDGEFYQRLLIAGYICLYVPKAVAYHEYKPFTSTRKFRALGQLYNRWVFILTHYSLILLLLIIPALIIYEILQFFFMIMKKMFFLYFKGNFLVIKNLSLILRKRKKIQSIRKVSDKEILFAGDLYISPALLSNKILRIFSISLSKLFELYWHAIKPIIP